VEAFDFILLIAALITIAASFLCGYETGKGRQIKKTKKYLADKMEILKKAIGER
jgi:hypothetical protein